MKINTQQYLKYSLFLLSFFFFYLPTYSQIEREISDNCDAQGWCWGQNPDVARDHFAYFSDQYDFKEYPLALKPLEWLLENAPKLHKNLYIRGEKIYKENIKIAKSVEEKISLEDKLLTLYQSRIDYFGQEAKVIQKQGKVAYLILKSRKDKEYDSLLYEFYHKILRLNTNKTYKTNLVFLTNSIITLKNKAAFSDTDVLVGYEEIFDILNYNLSQKQSKKQLQKWKKTKQNIDKLIVANIDLNCELIQKRAKSQFHNSTKDSLLIFAQRFYNYSNLINCKKSIIYLKTLETIFEAKPTVEIVLEIAQYHYQNKNLSEALKFYQKGEKITSNKHKLAELRLSKAYLLSRMNRNKEARKSALLATTEVKFAKQAYTFVGNLYMQTEQNCKFENEVEARAIYLAAYEMFLKAQNPQRMLDAQSQFPSMTDIFTHNYQIGDQIKLSCWANTFVTIRKRPK